MKAPHQLIIEMFQHSVFALTFEAEEVLGYRSASRDKVSRALSINLEQRTVEYEMTEKGLPTKRRVEYSPSLERLIEKLPRTLDSFDLKFQGLKVTEHGVSVAGPRDSVPSAETRDPWDSTKYYGKSPLGRTYGENGLKLADE